MCDASGPSLSSRNRAISPTTPASAMAMRMHRIHSVDSSDPIGNAMCRMRSRGCPRFSTYQIRAAEPTAEVLEQFLTRALSRHEATWRAAPATRRRYGRRRLRRGGAAPPRCRWRRRESLRAPRGSRPSVGALAPRRDAITPRRANLPRAGPRGAGDRNSLRVGKD